jgi:hypothetical protein
MAMAMAMVTVTSMAMAMQMETVTEKAMVTGMVMVTTVITATLGNGGKKAMTTKMAASATETAAGTDNKQFKVAADK